MRRNHWVCIDYSGARINPGIREFIQTCSNTNMELASSVRYRTVRCSSSMKNSAIVFMMLLTGTLLLSAQNPQSSAPAPSAGDYSGMYAFLQDGEFVQITVEDQGLVTGLISRYDDAANGKGQFVDQFFKEGKLAGAKLTFTTKAVHEVWYDFDGTVERGDSQNAGDEGYYLLKGKLTQYTTDANKKTTAKLQDVAFKSFPKDLDSAPAK